MANHSYESAESISRKKARTMKSMNPSEDAAERRRGQVRRAQRAYRNRKETAISNLSDRVQELEGLISAMRDTCRKLETSADEALEEPFCSILAPQAKTDSAVAELKKLLDTALPESQNTSNEATAVVARRTIQPSISRSSPTKTLIETSSDSVSIKDVADSALISDLFQHDTSMFDTSVFTDDLEQSMSLQANAQLASEFIPAIMGANCTSTYSYQERTFSRRFYRLCMERAVEFLTSEQVSPDRLHSHFRLAFSLSNKPRMIRRMQEVLRRGPDELLENFDVPYFSVGGAGSFSAWKNGNVGSDVLNETDLHIHGYAPPPTALATTKYGPYVMPQTELRQPFGYDGELGYFLQAIGYGGAWYDADDVEYCLASNGIHIEPMQSLVTIERQALTAVKQDVINLGMHYGQLSIHDEVTAQLGTVPDNSTAVPEHTQPYSPFETTKTAFTQMMSSKLILDVDRFLTMLTEKACCLGRTPGVRLADFWLALLSSTH